MKIQKRIISLLKNNKKGTKVKRVRHLLQYSKGVGERIIINCKRQSFENKRFFYKKYQFPLSKVIVYEDVEDKNFYSALQEFVIFGNLKVIGTEDILEPSSQEKYDRIELIDFRKASFNQPIVTDLEKIDISVMSLYEKVNHFFSQLIPTYMTYNILPSSIPYLYNFRTPYDKFNSDCLHKFPENSLYFDRQEIVYNEDFFKAQSIFINEEYLNKSIVIPPGENRTFPLIKFQPKFPGMHKAALYIKNNLTIITQIPVKGKGIANSLDVVGMLEVQDGEKKTYYSYRDYNPKIMKFKFVPEDFPELEQMIYCLECNFDSYKDKIFQRYFYLKNKGEDVIVVDKIYVNGQSCEAYGVKIVNCQGFKIEKNQEYEFLVQYKHSSAERKPKYIIRLYTSAPKQILDFTLEIDYPSFIYINEVMQFPYPWLKKAFQKIISLCMVTFILISFYLVFRYYRKQQIYQQACGLLGKNLLLTSEGLFDFYESYEDTDASSEESDEIKISKVQKKGISIKGKKEIKLRNSNNREYNISTKLKSRKIKLPKKDKLKKSIKVRYSKDKKARKSSIDKNKKLTKMSFKKGYLKLRSNTTDLVNQNNKEKINKESQLKSKKEKAESNSILIEDVIRKKRRYISSKELKKQKKRYKRMLRKQSKEKKIERQLEQKKREEEEKFLKVLEEESRLEDEKQVEHQKVKKSKKKKEKQQIPIKIKEKEESIKVQKAQIPLKKQQIRDIKLGKNVMKQKPIINERISKKQKKTSLPNSINKKFLPLTQNKKQKKDKQKRIMITKERNIAKIKRSKQIDKVSETELDRIEDSQEIKQKEQIQIQSSKQIQVSQEYKMKETNQSTKILRNQKQDSVNDIEHDDNIDIIPKIFVEDNNRTELSNPKIYTSDQNIDKKSDVNISKDEQKKDNPLDIIPKVQKETHFQNDRVVRIITSEKNSPNDSLCLQINVTDMDISSILQKPASEISMIQLKNSSESKDQINPPKTPDEKLVISQMKQNLEPLLKSEFIKNVQKTDTEESQSDDQEFMKKLAQEVQQKKQSFNVLKKKRDQFQGNEFLENLEQEIQQKKKNNQQKKIKLNFMNNQFLENIEEQIKKKKQNMMENAQNRVNNKSNRKQYLHDINQSNEKKKEINLIEVDKNENANYIVKEKGRIIQQQDQVKQMNQFQEKQEIQLEQEMLKNNEKEKSQEKESLPEEEKQSQNTDKENENQMIQDQLNYLEDMMNTHLKEEILKKEESITIIRPNEQIDEVSSNKIEEDPFDRFESSSEFVDLSDEEDQSQQESDFDSAEEDVTDDDTNLSGLSNQSRNALVQNIFGQDQNESVISQQEEPEQVEEEKQQNDNDYTNLGMKYFYQYQKNQYEKDYDTPGYLESLYSLNENKQRKSIWNKQNQGFFTNKSKPDLTTRVFNFFNPSKTEIQPSDPSNIPAQSPDRNLSETQDEQQFGNQHSYFREFLYKNKKKEQ